MKGKPGLYGTTQTSEDSEKAFIFLSKTAKRPVQSNEYTGDHQDQGKA